MYFSNKLVISLAKKSIVQWIYVSLEWQAKLFKSHRRLTVRENYIFKH